MRNNHLTLLMIVIITSGLLGVWGCDDAASRGGGVREKHVPGAMRLVSLSPALTQILVDLGLEDQIVGCYGSGMYRDPAAPKSAVIVGDLYQLDYEKLLVLKPTHVFLQPAAGGVPAKLRTLAADHDWAVHAFKIEDIDAVMRAVHEPDSDRCIGAAVGRTDAAGQLVDRVRGQLDAIERVMDDVARPRVLLIVGVESQTAAGPDTFLSQMLWIAGGRNAFAESGVLYPSFDKEKLLTMKPDVMVMTADSGASASAVDAMARIPKDWGELSIPAIEQGRVIVLGHPFALIPSTRMPEVSAQLARRLHPALSDRIDEALTGAIQP